MPPLLSRSASGRTSSTLPRAGPSQAGLGVDDQATAAGLDIAPRIHGDAAQDDRVWHGQQRFRVAHAILQRDKRWINEYGTQLLQRCLSRF